LFTPRGDSVVFLVDMLYNNDHEVVSVARHPDDIYYLYLDTNIEIEEYSMIRLIEKRR